TRSSPASVAPRSYADAGFPLSSRAVVGAVAFGRLAASHPSRARNRVVDRGRLMRGHVRKRGKGWAFVVELDADPVSGKRRQKWVSGFRTKAIAERELRRCLRLVDEGEDAFPEEISVEAFVLERWLPHLETQGRLRAGTIRNY